MKKNKIKPDPKKIIAIVLLIVFFITGAGAIITGLTSNNITEDPVQNIVTEIQVEEPAAADIDLNDPAITGGLVKIPEDKDYTWTTMYTTTAVNIRIAPSLDALVDTVAPINTEVQVGTLSEEWDDIVSIEEGWSYVKTNITESGIGYIYSQYLSKEKTVIKTTSRSMASTSQRSTSSYTQSKSQGVLTKSKGVNYYNGHKETWYSQRVLPGRRAKNSRSSCGFGWYN